MPVITAPAFPELALHAWAASGQPRPEGQEEGAVHADGVRGRGSMQTTCTFAATCFDGTADRP